MQTARLLALAGAACLAQTLAAAPAAAQGAQHFAVLNGGNEVSAGGQAAAGDPDGSGAASVLFVSANRICFSIAVVGIDRPTAAHIHDGVAGENGAVAITLTAPAVGNPGTSSGCVGGLAAALVNRLRETPSDFYVNVHTGRFPSGALRGQLF